MERITENGYEEAMNRTLRPYLETRRRNGYFLSSDGRPLFYSLFRPETNKETGTVAIVHGFTESIEKYAEVIGMFLGEGYRVCIYEQRGHGRSFHDNGQIHVTDIERFGIYADDLDRFVENIVRAQPGPYFLFAHSMGGGVSALYLERGGTLFSRAVLSSPLIAPFTFRLPTGVCRATIGMLVRAGNGEKKLVYEGNYPGKEEFRGSCTSSRARFYGYEHIKRRTPFFQNYCATNRWACQALELKKILLSKGAPEGIKIPVLVFSAGKDRVVSIPPQKKFASRIPEGIYRVVPDVKHEIFLSPDGVFHPYLETIFRFFKREGEFV